MENDTKAAAKQNNDADLVHLFQYIVEEPGNFFKKYVDREKPAYFPLFIVLFFLLYAFNASGAFLGQFVFGIGGMAMSPIFNIVFLAAGLINGIFAIIVLPLFYALRITLSGGSAGIAKAFRLLIYSSAVPAVVSISLIIVSKIIYLVPFDEEMRFTYVIVLLVKDVLVYAAMLLSVYISYNGVRAITDAEEFKSKIWFIILPVCWYVLTGAVTVFRDITMAVGFFRI